MGSRHPTATGASVVVEHTLGLAQVGRRFPLSTPVPTCDGWTLADLVWHLCEVQHFWGHIIGNRPSGPDDYERPDRPADGDLAELLESWCRHLATLLDEADPLDRAWSWSDDHSVAFTVRRQSHEALIHRFDAVLATGAPAPEVRPLLAADGVDELVTVMLSGVPGWAEYHPSPDTIHLVATDTGDHWKLEFGRMTGTSPDTGRTYDIVALEVLDELERPATTIGANALELDLWLWGRSDGAGLELTGDPTGAIRLRELVIDSTQ